MIAALAFALFHVTADARPLPPSAQSPPAGCVALPMPTLRGVDGSATNTAVGLRDLVASFLTGPSLRAIPLEARVPAQAIEEAKQKDCTAVLSITLTRKRSGGGGLGRVLGSAADAAAWRLPNGGTTGAIAARSAAVAGAAAASNIAENTKAKDEWQLEYRLTVDQAEQSGRHEGKAGSDGEDVVTPLVERMATVVAAAVTK